MRIARATAALLLALPLPGGPDLSSLAWAEEDVGDPQARTDYPWYPGELACSTLERLFEWSDDAGAHRESRVFGEGPWDVKTGRDVHTRWVEYESVTER